MKTQKRDIHTECFFLKILWIFWTLPVLLQRWCSTCLVCVHTLTLGKTEKGQSPEYFKIFGKNTIFNEHSVQYIHNVSIQYIHVSIQYLHNVSIQYVHVSIHHLHNVRLPYLQMLNNTYIMLEYNTYMCFENLFRLSVYNTYVMLV